MLRFFTLRTATAPWLALTFLFLLGCSKESDPVAPLTGSIEGTVSPAGAASTVMATAPGGQPVTAVPDARTGAFSFANLSAGTYQLGAVPTVGFNSPDKVAATVQRGATTKAALQLTHDGRIRGTVTWERNGTSYSAATFYGDVQRTFFSLEGDTPFDAAGNNQGVSFALYSASGIGVGTYPLGLANVPWGGFTFYFANGPFDLYETSYSGSQPVGQVVVTRFDLNARVAAGTFSYVAQPSLINSGTAASSQTITNGRFDITF